MPSPSSTPLILERIEALRCDISDIKTAVGSLAGDYQQFQLNYVKSHEKLEGKVAQDSKTIEDHERRLEAMEALIKPLVFQSRIIAVVGGVFLSVLIGFLWAIFTHTAVITFP